MYQKIVDLPLGAYVVDALHLATPDRAAFVCADGRVVVVAPHDTQDKQDITTQHTGAILSTCTGIGHSSVITGGDDGLVLETSVHGEMRTLDQAQGKWRDPVVSGANVLAAAAGKTITVFARGDKNVLPDHSSTVAALAFNHNSKRLAAAHYGGVSVWYATAKDQKAKVFSWKGSHISVIFSPDDKFVMTGTQENMLHGWFLKDGRDFEMAGYPSKIRSMGWSCDGRYLCTSGAEILIAWDCTGVGPMGRYPLEIGERGFGLVQRVACHPVLPIVALGHASGALALAHLETQQGVMLRGETDSPVSALRWSERGDYLLAGCESGLASLLDFR